MTGPLSRSPISRSEFGRLGKRGSYRLGTLAPLGVARPSAPTPFRPSFARPTHAGPRWAWIAAGLVGAGLIAMAAVAGLWFVPFVVGVIGGLAARWGEWRLRVMAPAVVVICAAGWGAALADEAAAGLPIGATARVIAAIGGLPAFAVVGVAVTLGVAVLLGLVGLWLGRALTPAPPS
jgi:hypothetical protein